MQEQEQNLNQPDKSQEIAGLIQEILNVLGVNARVGIEQNVNGYNFNISSEDSHLLIGQRGVNLQALQLLVNSITHKKFGFVARFTIDVDDYKKKREWYLRETAKKAIEQMKRTGRPVALEPMSAYDRRVIHAYLSADDNYDTESIGEEPNRRIVIRPKQNGF